MAKADKYWNEKQLLRDFGSGVNDVIGRGSLAGLVGGLGDIANLGENGLRGLLGLPQVTAWGGSEHIGKKLEQAGLVSSVRRPKTELLASLISPGAAAKTVLNAPKTARNMLKMLDNLEAPSTMRNMSQRGAIDVWHGSPHKFDEFKAMDNIGGGEGAQAYGHGGYHASAREVGEKYQKDLSGDYLTSGGSELFDPSKLEHLNVRSTINRDGIDSAIEKARQLVQGGGGASDLAAKDLATLERIKSAGGGERVSGNLYRNQLRWPDPAREAADPLNDKHFLDWDKPLSEQPYALEKLKGSDYLQEQLRAGGFRESDIDSGMFEGRHLVSAKRSGIADESGAMRELGIPGIRYLDGGSRSAGQGSHNYVTFDDALVNIMERNGQPVGNLAKMVAPQDEALRVAQANAAKPVSEGGLGLRLDNTPEERAAAMGFDTPQFHETKAENIPSIYQNGFDPMRSKAAASDSETPYGVFTKDTGRSIGLGGDTQVQIPLLVNKGNNAAFKDRGALRGYYGSHKNKELDDLWRAERVDDRVNGEKIDELGGMSKTPGVYAMSDAEIWREIDRIADGDPQRTAMIKRMLTEEVIKDGDNSVSIFNDEGSMGRATNTLISLDPRNIRSRFAAFDPMRKDSSDLLAGLAPLGLGALIAPPKEKKKKK